MPGRHSREGLSAWTRREDGFLLLEALIAVMIFAIVATTLTTILVSSTSATTRVKQQTIAEQAVMNQIEKIRALDYNSVGTVNGCVPGSLNSTTPFTGLGAAATLHTTVSYVSAGVPGTAQTGADYKQIAVSITRNSDGKVLAQATTDLAPTNLPSQTTATIKAAVSDYGAAGTPLQGVQVNLATGPSAPESCTTDSSGSVTFPGLTPNPTTGTQAYYDLSVVPPTGYQVLSDDAAGNPPVHVQLSPTQFWSTTLNVYKPATMIVNLLNLNGTTYAGSASVMVTSNDARTSGISKTFSYAGTPLSITNVVPADSPYLVPGQYSLQVSQTGYLTDSDGGTVPTGYPTTLTSTFNEYMIPQGVLDVTVKATHNATTLTCTAASVNLTLGPANVNLTQSTSGGKATFNALTPGGPSATPSPPLSSTGFTIKASEGSSSKTVTAFTVNPGPAHTSTTVNLGTWSGTTC
jgi:type II secretory pathway pseudopilin PulG